MPALNYKPRFAAAVADGSKPHTIRAWRKRPFMYGEPLMHYIGMRTTACKKIRPDTLCLAATPIEINPIRRTIRLKWSSHYYPGGRIYRDHWLILMLATRDGFASVDEFFQFFLEEHGRKFTGQLVEWRP